MISPSKKTISIFQCDLWKDQRKLETTTINGTEGLVKHYVSNEEKLIETQVLSYLSKTLKVANVPEILAEKNGYAILTYLKGIRIFNLFVELDLLSSEKLMDAQSIKKEVFSRCVINQKEIQHALLDFPANKDLTPYPIDKIYSLVELLSDCLRIKVHLEDIREEVEWLHHVCSKSAIVPFRDAATKNMVLVAPELWLGNFKSEEHRRDYIVSSIKNKKYESWLNSPIYDFDFSSCINTTTIEDDAISLMLHERTWVSDPSHASEITWIGKSDKQRAAATLFMRYYRFGGRKAAYRLLHPSGHRIRFRHDGDIFYFERLPSMLEKICPEFKNEIPNLIEFTELVAKQLKVPLTQFDYFRASSVARSKKYYVDMFPE